MKLPQLRPDGAQHFAYGTTLYILGRLFSKEFGLALAVAFALLKEIYDKVSGKGTPDVTDILYTIAAPIALYLEDTYVSP